MINSISMADVRRSFGRCTASPGFLDDFYAAFSNSSEEIRYRFRYTDGKKQRELLRTGLSFILMYADGRKSAGSMLDKIGQNHGEGHRDIPFWMFDNWKVALLNSVKKHDRYITWELLEAWEDALQKGIDRIARRRGVSTFNNSTSECYHKAELMA